MPRVFTADDIDYMANTLDMVMLRDTIHHAQVMAKVANAWEGTEYAENFPWQDLKESAELALDIKMAKVVKEPCKYHAPKEKVDIEFIKSHTDIVSLVSQYTRLRKSGRRFMGLCPLHSDKKSPSLVVYPDQGTFHCFGCHKGGDVIAFTMFKENKSFIDAARLLAGKI